MSTGRRAGRSGGCSRRGGWCCSVPAPGCSSWWCPPLSGGFRGEVIAVSTDDVEVSGVRSASSIADRGRRHRPGGGLGARRPQLGGVVIDAAHKGAHGLVVLTGCGDSDDDNRTVVNLARAYGVRAVGPDALGPDQHRCRGRTERQPCPDAPGRGGRHVLPVRGHRRLPAQLRAGPRSRAVLVPVHRRLRRRDRQRRDAVLGGRRRHPGLSAVAGLDRQPAQVLPDRPPPGPPQAGDRVRSGAGRPGRPLRRTGWARARRGGGDRRPVPPERCDRDAPTARDDRRRPGGGPAAAADRTAGAADHQLRRAGPADGGHRRGGRTAC